MISMRNPTVAVTPRGPSELCNLERKCLTLAAGGAGPEQIAAQLGVTGKEAQTLLYCAQRKLGASNTMNAVARYLANEMTGTMAN